MTTQDNADKIKIFEELFYMPWILGHKCNTSDEAMRPTRTPQEDAAPGPHCNCNLCGDPPGGMHLALKLGWDADVSR
jgi:hypothetical protein